MTLFDKIGNSKTNGLGGYEDGRGIELRFPLNKAEYENIKVEG
jgi:hypothetical protein